MIEKKNAAFTVVSNNYLSFAMVLAGSFLSTNDVDCFYICIVDDAGPKINIENESIKVIYFDDVDLPKKDFFKYQYSILELNTAVKPFVFRHIFEKFAISKLCYLDPDLYFYDDMREVWAGLDKYNVILTPHLLASVPEDGATPTETQILQSGTYNLGFLALRNGAESMKLLDWWCEKLWLDCVVDIPNGLFVDQKWMDLAPTLFSGVFILRDAGYNVAYWNLHERTITDKGRGRYQVNGCSPLVFFHYSGFNPTKPEVLSKHQSRTRLQGREDLSPLFKDYGEALLNNQFEEMQEIPFGFSWLPNGVLLPNSVSWLLRQAIRRSVFVPSPEEQPDAFCRWLMTPSFDFGYYQEVPLHTAIRHNRPDVNAAFPRTPRSAEGADGIHNWLHSSGINEEGMGDLLSGYGQFYGQASSISRICELYNRRDDVRNTVGNIFDSIKNFRVFIYWLQNHGVNEGGAISLEDVARFEKAWYGIMRALNFYFCRPDLQAAFPNLLSESVRYVDWLILNKRQVPNLTDDEILFFEASLEFIKEDIKRFQLSRNAVLADKAGGVIAVKNIDAVAENAEKYFGFESQKEVKNIVYKDQDVIYELYLQSVLDRIEGSEPDRGVAAFLDRLRSIGNQIPRLGQSSVERFFLKSLSTAAKQCEHLSVGVNLLSYATADTGMGESSRSMLATIAAAGLPYESSSILQPHIDISRVSEVEGCESVFANRLGGYGVSIVVANADQVPIVCRGGRWGVPGSRCIGYWVWETEQFPEEFSGSEDYFDAIFTPSNHSARAIEKTVAKPVKVLPHTLDWQGIHRASAEAPPRSLKYADPSRVTFGFAFDPKSSWERKNPEAVVTAFRNAFVDDYSGVELVLKVNSRSEMSFRYQRLLEQTRDLPLKVISQSMSREESLEFFAELDVYVSLHRAEGFGLTLAETMAMGIPVIATNYSGNVDFMPAGSAALIDYDLIESKAVEGAYPIGTVWADPDLNQASEEMKRLCDPYERTRLGLQGKATVEELLGVEQLGGRLRTYLRDLDMIPVSDS